MMRQLWFIVTLAPVLLAADPASSELAPAIERYKADLESLTRTYPITISATRQARLNRFLEEQQASLRQMEFEKLSRDGQIDYILLRNALERLRGTVARDTRRAAEVEPLIPFYKTIV